MEYITENAQATFKFGQKIGDILISSYPQGRILCLYGDLGSGKTTFIQGISKSLGIEKPVPSPTFIIVRQYDIDIKLYKYFYHIDLYRLDKNADLMVLGLSDFFTDKSSLVAIEWADKLEKMKPSNCLEIYFSILDSNKRRIEIKSPDDNFIRRINSKHAR